MSTAASTSNLRWRARVAKESLSTPDADDSSLNMKPKSGRVARRLFGLSRKTLILSSVAAGAVGSSLWSLQVTHSAFVLMTATLTVAFAVLVLLQDRWLVRYGSLTAQVEETRQRLSSMKAHNERLVRQWTQLDRDFDRLHDVQSQLTRLVGDQANDVRRLVKITSEYRETHAGLQRALQRQVQTTILQCLLQADANADFALSGRELEQLIVRLQNIPGLEIDEQLVRGILIDEAGGQAIGLPSMVRLLRQVATDADKSRGPAILSSPSRPRFLPSPPRLRSKTVFGFCPDRLGTKVDEKKEGDLHEC